MENSSKVLLGDGCTRKARAGPKSRKRCGGQAGHQGHALAQVERPDQVVTHRPRVCEACQCELAEVAGHVKERRQIHELPEMRLLVTEHRVESICCPNCQHRTSASFPAGVTAPAQYEPQLQALPGSV